MKEAAEQTDVEQEVEGRGLSCPARRTRPQREAHSRERPGAVGLKTRKTRDAERLWFLSAALVGIRSAKRPSLFEPMSGVRLPVTAQPKAIFFGSMTCLNFWNCY